MKRTTIDATDENVLQSIQDKIGNRNACILEFIKTLDSIEDNRFISLDARWGEGKTFYVRQIEKTLEYQTMKKFDTDDIQAKLDKMNPYFSKTVLEKLDLEHLYLPVYYDAWLYDNHSDPLLSLLYVIVKKCGKMINSNLTKEKSGRIKELLQSIQVNLPFFSINGEGVVNALSDKNIFEEIQLAEDIRNEVKLILDEVIVEWTQKLVIFIDELDRCRPSYALEMLERTKHYFDDDRIIFIVSVNKEQLIHTISNYYGTGFDSTGYLNKFFDLEAHLPELQTYDTEIIVNNQSHYHLKKISNALVKYYKLSRRDFLIYREKISKLETCMIINDYSLEGRIASMFVPIIIMLDMKNVEEKRRFINGESNLLELMKMIPEGENLYESCGQSNLDLNDRIEDGYQKIKTVYDFMFGNLSIEKFRENNIMIKSGFKEEILSCCGQMLMYT